MTYRSPASCFPRCDYEQRTDASLKSEAILSPAGKTRCVRPRRPRPIEKSHLGSSRTSRATTDPRCCRLQIVQPRCHSRSGLRFCQPAQHWS